MVSPDVSRQAITHTVTALTAIYSNQTVFPYMYFNISNIFTDKYNDFIDANRMENASDRLKTMKKLVCVCIYELIHDLHDHLRVCVWKQSGRFNWFISIVIPLVSPP